MARKSQLIRCSGKRRIVVHDAEKNKAKLIAFIVFMSKQMFKPADSVRCILK